MSLLRGAIDRLALVLLILGAGLVPGYVAQYQQQIGGRLDQVRLDLAPFQRIANRQHGGSLDALVLHHLASDDATFFAEGRALQSMLDSEQRLERTFAGLDTTLPAQLVYLLRHPDRATARATWELYDPTLSVTPGAMVFAAAVGGGIWVALYLTIGGCARLLRGRPRKRA
jgi:hypothetical protein